MKEIKLYEGKEPELKLRKESYGFYVDHKDGMGFFVAINEEDGTLQFAGSCGMGADYINQIVLEEERLFILSKTNLKYLLGKIVPGSENERRYMKPEDWVKEVNELYKEN